LGVFAEPTPQLTGVAVIATELVVGGLVALGIATRWAAVAGALVNFAFFLTSSWTVQPYFLGSDSIYTVAWITLALVGDQGVLTARPLLLGRSQPAQPVDQRRRRLLLQLGGAAVAVVWVLSVLPRPKASALANQPESTPSASPTAIPSPTGTTIGTTADMEAQGFLNFQDPATGDPAVAVSLPGGRVVAYDAICTHAGCDVAYDSSQKLLACPCHGALFDPAHAGAVVGGPATAPLPAIRIEAASDGGLYAG